MTLSWRYSQQLWVGWGRISLAERLNGEMREGGVPDTEEEAEHIALLLFVELANVFVRAHGAAVCCRKSAIAHRRINFSLK